MYKIIAAAAIAATAFSASSAAFAGERYVRGGYHHHRATVVGSYTKHVVVKTVKYRVVPVHYKIIARKVLVRPAQRVPYRVPAIRRQVAETVMIKPARRIWTIYYDKYGRKIGCWIDKPARYATRYRTVTIRPASIGYNVVPAQYRTVTHKVRVR